MSITMQGSWTVRVKSKSAAWQQRFQIIGSGSADGTYDGLTSIPPIFVNGDQWTIKIQHKPTGQPWRDSAMRLGNPAVSAGLVKFDIRSNDTGGDEDYNDLILTCSMPVSASEFVVYGNVRTYNGPCIFNPCYPYYYAIDRPEILERIRNIPEIWRIVEKLYPELVKPPRIKPIPLPDPPPFRPLVIPIGVENPAAGALFRSNRLASQLDPADFAIDAPSTAGSVPTMPSMARQEKAAETREEMARQVVDARAYEKAAVDELAGTAEAVLINGAPLGAGASLIERNELLAVATIVDKLKYRWHCDVDPAPGLLLRFQEYDRTEAEKLGGAYTGDGDRQNLGLAVTDELGNYIFRFSRSLIELAEEASDMGPGETLATEILPDLILQVLGTGLEVEYETAPYYNIPNLRRINLCIPYDRVHPTRECAGDRVIQRIGDVIVLHSALGGTPNTLDSSGRITCRNANAPVVDCAAWRGGLRLYACFGDPDVAYYTIRYKRHGIDSGFQFASQEHKLNYIPDFAPNYTGTPVGSTLRSVHVDGGAAQMVPTYESHEGDLNWIENDLKIILSSGLYRPATNPGPVTFRIQAYTTAGDLVADTTDEIKLYIDNRPASGDIVSITMGATTLGDCALFELADPKAPLTVRYRVDDPEGFLHSYSLHVTRGNNVPRPVTISAGVTPHAYVPAPGACVDFHGTGDEPAADIDNYVTTTLIPSGGEDWLPAGYNFCAFAFTLRAWDRTTNGRTAHPLAVFWQDLIGLALAP